MKIYKIIFCGVMAIYFSYASAQNKPWENALQMAFSKDGKNFGPASVFQDSAGVPSICRKNGDTLMGVFQWFRGPQGSPTWDRVAVKYSYDEGKTWTEPFPIRLSGLPPGYQRPFDPTLVRLNADSLRLYFSSSRSMPMMGEDSIIDCYSAISVNGLDYVFEQGARVDHPSRRLIDPAVIYFKNSWHYAAPKGAPQEGAWHYISPDGVNFKAVPDIPSDAIHNWTGNYVVVDTGELRFYGSGGKIWFNTTSNGGQWQGYTETNIMQGGDPSVIRLNNDSFMIVYVGFKNALRSSSPQPPAWVIYPNPLHTKEGLHMQKPSEINGGQYTIYGIDGRKYAQGQVEDIIYFDGIQAGIYMLQIISSGGERGSGELYISKLLVY